MIPVSIGVMAFNEERNVGLCLSAIRRQALNDFFLREIIVVISGCTDSTESIVKEHARDDPRIKVIKERVRNGKASAINLFLRQASSSLLVLATADSIIAPDCLQKLLRPLRINPRVGMTCGRPLTVGPTIGSVGLIARLHWCLHHHISLRVPKAGEVIAFRNHDRVLYERTWADEAEIAADVSERSLEIVYVPEAIVYVGVPRFLRELVRQRRRIHAGHLDIFQRRRYMVSTLPVGSCARSLVGAVRAEPAFAMVIPLAVPLEILCRLLGWWDHLTKKSNGVWEPIVSTKDLRLNNQHIPGNTFRTNGRTSYNEGESAFQSGAVPDPVARP